MKKLIFALSCSLVLFSCTKDDDSSHQTPLVVLHYKQTYCGDKWGPAQLTDSATLVNLGRFLDTQQLYHTQESIVLENSPELCQACTCHSGKVIHVRTVAAQEQAFNNLGFVR